VLRPEEGKPDQISNDHFLPPFHRYIYVVLFAYSRLTLIMEDPLISPSKARRDAARARDWSYVMSWLAKKYAPHPVPRFEHNEEVLQSLLALMAANDNADAEAELQYRAEEEELGQFKERQGGAVDDPVHKLLGEVEASLDEKGKEALRDLAETSVVLGTLKTDAATLGSRMVEVTRDEFDTAQRLSSVKVVQAYLEREIALLERDMASLREREDEGVAETLRHQTTQYNRDAKQVGMKLVEYKDRIAALERAKVAGPQLEDVKVDEKEVLTLQTRVTNLEKQLAEYHNFPPDLEAAKEEYQRSQRELQNLTKRRDELFDQDLARHL
jgi:HAUS augmin-like complex subunit 1